MAHAAEITSTAFGFDNSYARLPENFYARVAPTPVPAPRLLRLNRSLAEHLGLDPATLEGGEGAEIFAGNRVPEDAEPLAMAYAGHQFGTFVPQLGDGRALLLGEVIDRSGVRRDIQLKGSGRTPFSRGGDGRAVLEYVMREYLASEAMAGLGIPSTRALAMAATGQTVTRQQREPGAVLTRVADSLVRVGTFQYFAARGDWSSVRTLADYVIARHYPECASAKQPYLRLLEQLIERTARLIADWMGVGFIHGVMNTDNVSVVGETIDFGPWAFMDAYSPDAVFSAIDVHGRYAFNQQPGIGVWNMARFAETLLPLIDEDAERGVEKAQDALGGFMPAFEAAYHRALTAKIGLEGAGEGDVALAAELLDGMAANNADYTLTFRRLSAVRVEDPGSDAPLRALFDAPEAFDAWAQKWRARLAKEARSDDERRAAMRAVNPAFVPRNHWIKYAADTAKESGDLQPFDDLLALAAHPFEDDAERQAYTQPPLPEQVIPHTFCGT